MICDRINVLVTGLRRRKKPTIKSAMPESSVAHQGEMVLSFNGLSSVVLEAAMEEYLSVPNWQYLRDFAINNSVTRLYYEPSST